MSWEVRSLDELIDEGIIELGRGKVISKRDLEANPGTYPVYSSAKENDGMFGVYGQYMFDEELITWSVDGGGNLFHRPKHKFSVTNVGGTLRILDRSLLDYQYLYHVLTYLHARIPFDWVLKAHPSVIRRLYQEIPLPPLPEQQRIVAKLDAAFAALREVEGHLERNRANARDLFESYLNGVFEGKEGWETSPLAELTEFFSDGDWIESKDQSPEGIRLVQTGNIGVGEYKDKADKARFISEATFHRLRCTDVLPGDCLISRLPEPVGRGCIIPYLGTRMITGVDCSIVRFDRTKVLPEFFVYFSQTRDYMAEVNALVTGTTRSRISRSNLGRITVRYPSTKEQLNILSELDRLKAQIDALEATYQKKLLELEGLKKGLLGAAFRGEL